MNNPPGSILAVGGAEDKVKKRGILQRFLRGTVEFVVPQGGALSVIGLRAKLDGTLTTIPLLVK